MSDALSYFLQTDLAKGLMQQVCPSLLAVPDKS